MQVFKKNIFVTGNVTYKDLDLSFLAHPNTNDLVSKTDEEAIKQSLRNLIYTNFAERPFRPQLYGGITELLFEPMDQVTKLILEERLVTLFTNWEPRVEIQSVSVKEQDFDRNSVTISITYNVQNAFSNQELELLIKRVR